MNLVAADLRFRSLLPWILAALILSMAPYLYGWLTAPPHMAFSGILANQDDFSTYLAAIRQGAAGRWLFHLTFSPEQWQPKLMLLPYLLIGKIARPLGGSPVFWFHMMRLGALLFTATAIWIWVRELFPRRARLQLTTWLLIVFGSGFSWLLYPLLANGSSFRIFPDISMPEWSFLLVSINPPHFMLGLGLELLLFATLLRLLKADANEWKWTVTGGVLAASLGLTYVYHLAVTAAITALYLLLFAWRKQQIPWRKWVLAGVMSLPFLPLLFYYIVWVNRDPVWAAYASIDHVISPPTPLALFIGAGLLGLLALPGFPRWWREGQEPLVPIWLVVNLFLMYSRIVPYSGRFTLGVIVPICTLAAYGLETAVLPWLQDTLFYKQFSRLTPTPRESLRRVILLLTMPSGLMMILFTIKSTTLNKDFPNYYPQSELQAVQWLVANTDPETDLILAHYPMGNFLPAATNTRVFLGKFDFTPGFDEKLALLQQYWDEETEAAWRQEFLAEWGITHVYAGNFERSLGNGPSPKGELVYDREGVQIYRILQTRYSHR